MDHYPPISRPYNPIQFPYLGGEYDGGDFAGYPSRQQWDTDQLQRGNLQNKSAHDAARFLQTWLYFGMMHEILGIPIVTADFIFVDEHKQRFITTRRLREYLHRWKLQIDRETESQGDALLRRNQRVVDCLDHSYNVWNGLKHLQVDPKIELSIQLLASALEHAVTSICAIDVEDAPWRLSRNDFITERMVKDGWCPTVVEQISSTNHLALQSYASLLGPPHPKLEHENCHAGDHGCAAKNVDERSYVTKHHRVHCKCDDIAVDLDMLRGIVQDGDIPLVHVEYQGSRPLLRILPFRKGMHYTAVSHVWSDGLGNPNHNSLPKCQLQEIVRLIEALPPIQQYSSEGIQFDDRAWRDPLPLKPVAPGEQTMDKQPHYFWMDTLCVPLSPAERRKDAIKSMRSIYSRAIRVLVLDAELMRSPMASNSEEKLTRMTCSTWIRRLWTLQEAALARTVLYQFAEESVIILDDPPTAQVYERFYDNEIGYYSHLFDFSWWKQASVSTELQRIIKVWQALKSRSTSKEADEPFCVATLLDMDLGEFLKVSDTERTKKLWSMHTQLPAAVLFLPGEKLPEENYGWAPASVLNCRNVGIPQSVPATVTPKGLCVTLPGIVFTPSRNAVEAVMACDLEAEIFYIRRNMKLGSPSWKGLNLHERGDLAVILGQNPTANPTERPPLVACIGALVSITKMEGEELFVKYLRMVSVIGKDSRFNKYPNPAWSDVETIEKTRVSSAAYTDVAQKWCVG
ncbi:MAG: hypothetical protein M1827_002505 [Pycnora praestabilis]|nr:MAG: hypothetical protein M1827_002505 [Pycnora praestabilis]